MQLEAQNGILIMLDEFSSQSQHLTIRENKLMKMKLIKGTPKTKHAQTMWKRNTNLVEPIFAYFKSMFCG